jgi:hypothetical protein
VTKEKTGVVFEGEVLVVAGDALLNATAMLVETEGFWGGLLTMRSVAGAELVQEAPHQKLYITVDTETPGAFTARRTDPRSPVIRVTGKGAAPFWPGIRARRKK